MFRFAWNIANNKITTFTNVISTVLLYSSWNLFRTFYFYVVGGNRALNRTTGTGAMPAISAANTRWWMCTNRSTCKNIYGKKSMWNILSANGGKSNRIQMKCMRPTAANHSNRSKLLLFLLFVAHFQMIRTASHISLQQVRELFPLCEAANWCLRR